MSNKNHRTNSEGSYLLILYLYCVHDVGVSSTFLFPRRLSIVVSSVVGAGVRTYISCWWYAARWIDQCMWELNTAYLPDRVIHTYWINWRTPVSVYIYWTSVAIGLIYLLALLVVADPHRGRSELD
jgi:hypothetical protein